jgi:hypothetical protein
VKITLLNATSVAAMVFVATVALPAAAQSVKADDGSSALNGSTQTNNTTTNTTLNATLTAVDSSGSGSDNSKVIDSGNTKVDDSYNNNAKTIASNNSLTSNSTKTSNSSKDSHNATNIALTDSFNDNSVRFSKFEGAKGGAASQGVFGAGSIVANTNLASYVSGSSVRFYGSKESAGTDNSLNNGGSAFQNFAGLGSFNQNTGVGASQNASVNVAVSTRDINF